MVPLLVSYLKYKYQFAINSGYMKKKWDQPAYKSHVIIIINFFEVGMSGTFQIKKFLVFLFQSVLSQFWFNPYLKIFSYGLLTNPSIITSCYFLYCFDTFSMQFIQMWHLRIISKINQKKLYKNIILTKYMKKNI